LSPAAAVFRAKTSPFRAFDGAKGMPRLFGTHHGRLSGRGVLSWRAAILIASGKDKSSPLELKIDFRGLVESLSRHTMERPGRLVAFLAG
jgi:hypothetical protein